MRIYRQTARPLDTLLGREERLVYTLCQQETSDVVLAHRSGLALDRLEEVLKTLQARGLVELLVSSEKTSGLKQAPAQTGALDQAKTRLVKVLQSSLGTQASRYVQEIEAAVSLAELEERALKQVLRLRLAVSQEAARTLEAEIRATFG